MARYLGEGFINGTVDGIRRWFARSPEAIKNEIARGGSPSIERAGLPFNLVSQFGYDSLAEHLRIDQDLQSRYTDYEEMDEFGEISTALDIYADDSAMPDMESGMSIWVESENSSVENELNDMLHKRILIEDDIWGLERTVAKYGNAFGELLVDKSGVVGINFLPPPTIRRVEGPRGQLLGFVQDVRGEFNLSMEDFYKLAKQRDQGRPPGELTVFEDWELVHWRLRGKHLRSVYGHGVVDAARWIWKRLALLEDALLIYKLSRAPARYAFYVDVGEYDMERGLAYVNRVKNQFVKKKFVNPATGKLDMRHNPLCLAGDTEVHCLDGSSKTIVEMVAAYEAGDEQWVWGTDLDNSGRVRPVRVEWAGKTRQNAELVEITLDNGKLIRVTPDHKMIRRSGEKVEAQLLEPGDSLMPMRRRISRKDKGETLDGYELIYCPKAQKSLYGHRVVASDLGLREKGQLVHHVDFDALNNDPSNLVGMTWKEHNVLHTYLGHSGGAALARARIGDPEVDDRLREASRRNITAYNRSEGRREQVSRWNEERDQGRFIREYNASEKHEEDNEIRREAMRGHWSDDEWRRQASEAMRIKFPLSFVEGVRSIIRDNPGASMEAIADAATDVLLDELREANTRSIDSIHRHMLAKMVKSEGFDSFAGFKSDAIDDNCKVVSVRRLAETEDTYTLTVSPCHTFGLSAGIFVCNSHDEDFFIPSKGGKDSTRIEVLQGPDYAEVDTVEYHRDKLVSALKVPKMYMGFGGEEVKASLSTADIRFARTVMRIQRETRGGIRKVCRVHLIARGMDVERHDYDVKMSVPSSILELAQIEVLSATADLAERTREYLPVQWALTNLFHMSEQEAEKLMDMKEEEKVRQAKTEAKVAKMMAAAEGPQEGEGERGFGQVPRGNDDEDEEEEEPNKADDKGDEEDADKEAEKEKAEKEKEKEAEKKGKPKKPKAPKKETFRRPAGQMLMMEKRLNRMLESHHKRVERMFDTKIRDSSRAESKVREAINSDPRMRTRVRELRQLLGEMRGR